MKNHLSFVIQAFWLPIGLAAIAVSATAYVCQDVDWPLLLWFCAIAAGGGVFLGALAGGAIDGY